MKRILAVLLCILILSQCSREPALHDSNGRQIASQDWHGKWLILNYWAEWCEGCRLEIPQLNTFYRQNHDSSVVMYGVDFDGLSGKALQQAVKKMGFAFPVLADNPAQRWSLRVPGVLPVTFIISPDGHIRQMLAGPQTMASLNKALQALRQQG